MEQGYPAGSKYLSYDQDTGVHTAVLNSKRQLLTISSIDELIDNSIPFIGTPLGNIPFADILDVQNVGKRQKSSSWNL